MAADRIPVTVIHGDGIGPEIVGATLRVLKAMGAPFGWDEQPAGLSALEQHGDALSAARSKASAALGWP